MQTNAAAQVVLRSKTPWRRGTMHLVMSSLDFLKMDISGRLVAVKSTNAASEVGRYRQVARRIDRRPVVGPIGGYFLRPPGGKLVCATVRWSCDGETGLVFHKTLGVETVMEWRRYRGM